MKAPALRKLNLVSKIKVYYSFLKANWSKHDEHQDDNGDIWMLVRRVKKKVQEELVLQVYLKLGDTGPVKEENGGGWWGRKVPGGTEYGGGKA